MEVLCQINLFMWSVQSSLTLRLLKPPDHSAWPLFIEGPA